MQISTDDADSFSIENHIRDISSEIKKKEMFCIKNWIECDNINNNKKEIGRNRGDKNILTYFFIVVKDM